MYLAVVKLLESGRKYSKGELLHFKGHNRVNELSYFLSFRVSRSLSDLSFQSNSVNPHHEKVMRIHDFRRIFAWKFAVFAVLAFGQWVNHSDLERESEDLQSVLLFLSCHVSMITTMITTMPISFHRPCTTSLRNRDFPRPFVTLGISCRGSRRVKPRVNCLDPIQISFYVFFFLRWNANGFDATNNADNKFT